MLSCSAVLVGRMFPPQVVLPEKYGIYVLTEAHREDWGPRGGMRSPILHPHAEEGGRGSVRWGTYVQSPEAYHIQQMTDRLV